MFFDDYINYSDAKIRKSLFWDYNMDLFDWQKMQIVVTKRVIERGAIEDFYGLLNLYGVENVKKTIKEIPYLNDKDMNFAAKIFNIKKENLLCYTRKQLRPQLWNF